MLDYRAFLFPMVTFLVSGCDVPVSGPAQPGSDAASAEVNQQYAEPTLPDAVLEVVEVQKIQGVKRMVEVRLSRRLSLADLESTGRAVFALDSASYQRTFISYLLAHQDSGKGYWATTHFDPEMEARILQLTRQDVDHFNTHRSTLEGARLVGHWLGESFWESIFLRGNEIVVRWTDPADAKAHLDFVYPFDTSVGQHCEVKNGHLHLLKGNAFGDVRILGRHGVIKDADTDGVFRKSDQPVQFNESLFEEILSR